jgi:hypothetical protein
MRLKGGMMEQWKRRGGEGENKVRMRMRMGMKMRKLSPSGTICW